jgi:NAD(P)-dependent dehydrogenase (short-subunit alcohol dehydrogenase family)
MTTDISMRAQSPGARLRSRRIVVTGAASGIGRCTASLFAAEGAALALLDSNPDRLGETARMSNAQAFAADVTDEAAVGRAIERASDAMGGIDGLVSAAGVMMRGGVLEIGLQEWRRVIDVNLTGSFIVVRACLPFMRQAPAASIVTLGSAQGLLPNVPNRTAYAASKGGLVNLTRALAAELAPKIRVNCVCPGLVDTPMADGVRGNVCNYALGRIAEPMEIANAILFLTSYESSYVTGATLAADGGRSFH